MSDSKKRINAYRIGDGWQENFKHINYSDMAIAVKAILTKRELNRQYDRLGNHKGTNGRYQVLTLDEQVFRILVLMDSQMDAKLKTVWGGGQIPSGEVLTASAQKIYVGHDLYCPCPACSERTTAFLKNRSRPNTKPNES